MRNPNKIQMKYEFKLDSRQSIILLVAFLLILAFAFGLGVKTGKHFAKISQPDKAADFVEELQNREIDLEKARQKMIENEAPAEPEIAAVPEPTIPTEAELGASSKADQEKELAQNEAAEKIAKAEAKAAAEAEKSKKEEQRKKEEQARKEAEKKAIAEKEAAKKKEEKKAEKSADSESKAPSGSYFTLQLASFPAKDGADKFVKNFKPFDSRKPFITEVDLAEKGKWYRVKIGKFESREQAMAYQSIFEARTGRSTMIVMDAN